MGRSLKDEIEVVREAMLNAAMKEGLCAKQTLILSQRLDRLMNQLTTERENQCCPDKTNTSVHI